jgi:hypothetical protein
MDNVLQFAEDTQDFEMPSHGRSAKFSTVSEALAALQAKFGPQVEIAQTENFDSHYGTINHWCRGVPSTTTPKIIEMPPVEYTTDLDRYSHPTYRRRQE